jgi:hypothetical protein
MTTDYRAMCAELLLFSEEAGEICMNESLWPKSDPTCTLQQRARALLAHPTPQPVAVGERLPGPEDCDEKGRCWWHRYTPTKEWHLQRVYIGRYNYWLPANALPTPEAT